MLQAYKKKKKKTTTKKPKNKISKVTKMKLDKKNDFKQIGL